MNDCINMASCEAISGLVLLTFGTVLGLIGVATTDWINASANVTYYNSAYDLVSRRPDSMCRVGLWEHCCTDVYENQCSPLTRKVNGKYIFITIKYVLL